MIAKRRLRLGIVRALMVVLGVGLITGLASGQTFSPYSVFQNMTLAELATLQVKLTYVGPQRELRQSIVITATGQTPNLALFVPFQRAGISYANDSLTFLTFSASTAQLQTMIANVGTLSAVTAGTVSPTPYLSFSMVNTAGGTKAFESILNVADAANLFIQMKAAFSGVSAGLLQLSTLECSMGIVEPGVPTNVTSSTSVTFTGIRLNRTTGKFSGTVTVKNTSAAPINAPISVILQLPSGVTLFDAQGLTCGLLPQGRPFINLPASLAAAASVSLTLEFENPGLLPITVGTQVFAGPGGR